METRIISLLETVNQNIPKRQKTAVYQTIGKIIHTAFSRDGGNDVIHMSVNSLADGQEFLQHLVSNLIKNKTFILSGIQLVKQHGQIGVTDEDNHYDQSAA